MLALPNQRWSLDFVHDQMATGRRFRILNIVDDVTRECLRAVLDTSISGKRVVRDLGDLIAVRTLHCCTSGDIRKPLTLIWGGLRGGILVALALGLPDVPTRSIALAATYIVVLASVIVQGGTVERVLDRAKARSPNS